MWIFHYKFVAAVVLDKGAIFHLDGLHALYNKYEIGTVSLTADTCWNVTGTLSFDCVYFPRLCAFLTTIIEL